MGELTLAKEWYRYNQRVRNHYLDTILKLPAKERTRDRGASFPSIQDVFIHVLDAYRSWFHHAAYKDDPSYEPPPLVKPSPQEIHRAVEETNTLVSGYLRSLVEADMGKWITLTYYQENGKKGQTRIKNRDMIWHLVEEELQHRGELNALLWQIDVDPPIVGWNDESVRKQKREAKR